MRMVGKSRVRVEEVQVAPIKEWFRAKDGKRHRKFAPPFQPTSLTQPLHLGGNSLCYMIQIAHVMGCDPIWAMGFTLKNGGGYFFGPRNPVTRNPSFYDLEGERALEWLRWYEANYQNRVRLLPGWDGPVYSVFRTEAPHEAAGHLPGFEDGPSTRERDAVPHGQVGSQAT